MLAAIIGLAMALVGTGDATTAPAPSAPRPIPRATPGEITAARLEGDALLAAAGAQDLFENDTGLYGTAGILLRHRASGFVCLFDPGRPRNHVIVYPNVHRGDDVGCETLTAAGDRTTNFTRDGHTDAQTLGGAAQAIALRVAGARPAPAPTDVQSFAGQFPNAPPPGSARFVTPETFEEVISAHVDGWLVEMRFTAPRLLARSNRLDLIWYETVSERMRHGARGVATAPAAAKDAAVPKAEEIEAARTAGDRVIADSHTETLFENITDSRLTALRHRPSGLVCRFEPSLGAILIGTKLGVTTRPDAVNCLGGFGAFEDMMSITLNPGGLTADQALAEAVGNAHALYSDLRPFEGPTATLPTATMKGDASLPPHMAARLISAPGPEARYVYLCAAIVGPWIIAERVVGPAAQALSGDVMGELMMLAAIGDVRKTGGVKVAAPP